MSYAAATIHADARFARRGDENSLDWPASPDSAIFERASALRISTIVYRTAVKMGQEWTSGRREKSGRRSGAWWYTPPS